MNDDQLYINEAPLLLSNNSLAFSQVLLDPNLKSIRTEQ